MKNTEWRHLDERARELAWAREKAARDEHGRLLFAKEEGRAEGRAEAWAFLAQNIPRLFVLFYPEFAAPEVLERIRKIEEIERQQSLMNAMLEQKPFEEILALL